LSDDREAAPAVPQPFDALRELVQTPAGRAQMLQRIDGFITDTERTRENIERARGLVRDGYVPVLYANHQSHADKLVLSGITQALVEDEVGEQISAFLVPVAATIESGAQGSYVQQLMSLFDRLYLDRGYGPDVPFITDNDRQTRGIEGSNTESVKRLMDAPRERHGLVIFPEATLRGGRRGDDGAVHGAQEVTSATGSGLIGYPRFWLKRKLGEAVFVPVGISGSYRLYPPDPGRNEIPSEVIANILGGGPADPLVDISAGTPFTYAELRDEIGEEPNPKQTKHLYLMMNKVATLLPAEERGYYSSAG
jgi:1-acyl-sn-glycerol-3-phosphate acyltransferase